MKRKKKVKILWAIYTVTRQKKERLTQITGGNAKTVGWVAKSTI